MKPWYQSKIIWANFLFVILAGVSAASQQDWAAEHMGYFVLAQSLINVVLRFLTNQPVTLGKTV